MRPVRTTLVVAALALALGGCAHGSPRAASPATASRSGSTSGPGPARSDPGDGSSHAAGTTPAPPSATQLAGPGVSPAPGSLASDGLASDGPAAPSAAAAGLAASLSPAPAGFHRSTAAGADNGPIDAADFDAEEGAGAGRGLRFAAGTSVQYDANAGGRSVSYALLRFGTTAEAVAFATRIAAELLAGASAEHPVAGVVARIPGSVTQRATVSYALHGNDFGVIARAGAVVMLVDLHAQDVRASYPAEVAAAALTQYRRLPGH